MLFKDRIFTVRPSMFRSHPVAYIFTTSTVVISSLSMLNESREVFYTAAFVSFLSSFILLRWWIRTLTTRLVVTPTRVAQLQGLLSRTFVQMRHTHIQNVYVRQSMFQRLMGAGSVSLSSSGEHDVEINIGGIPSPDQVVERIQKIIDDYAS